MGDKSPGAELRPPKLTLVQAPAIEKRKEVLGIGNGQISDPSGIEFSDQKIENFAIPAISPRPPHQNAFLGYLAAISGPSRVPVSQSLRLIAAILTGGRLGPAEIDWGALRFAHTAAIRSLLIERYSTGTANRHLSALRQVIRYAWRLGQMTAEDCLRAVEIAAAKGETIPKGRALTQGEINALFEGCGDGTIGGVRDAALIGVLFGCGLRRSEAVNLDLDQLDRESGALTIRHGKGNKDRTAYLAPGADEAMKDWLELRGNEKGPLFVPVLKGSRIAFQRLTPHAILKMLHRRADVAVVPRFSPHDLRRTFISTLLDAGADISAVRALAGHANVNTTIRYDRRGERAKQTAAKLIHVPYVRAEVRTGRR